MSIYNKIRIIFVVSFLFVTAFFASTLYIEKSQYIHHIEKRYVRTALFLQRYFRRSMHRGEGIDFSDETVKLYLNESNFRSIPSNREASIRKDVKVIKKRKVLRSKLTIFTSKGKHYLLLENHRFHILLQDRRENFSSFTLLWGYIASLGFLLALYLWLIRSLKPLKTLQRKIEEVSKGDLTLSFKSEKSDEIAQVSNAFDDALRKLESLIDSRQLFLRAIMHELKTPIGKGKILNTFLAEERLKDSYDEVFARLELLLDEFAKIEQMLSANYEVKFVKYNAKDLVEQALDLMILDDKILAERVSLIENGSLILSTDFTLFPLALKNLIDNAIKYSTDHKVTIIIDTNGISVESSGMEFTKNIESYYQPFHARSNGLGLGLYIVHNSLKMLRLNLNYLYIEGKNSFKITKRD